MRWLAGILAFVSQAVFAGVTAGSMLLGGAQITTPTGGVTTVFDYSAGFPSADQSQFTGSSDANVPAFTAGNAMQVINGTAGVHEAGAVWYNTKVNVNAFTTDFTFQRFYGANPTESIGTGDGATVTFNKSGAPLSQAVLPNTLTITAGSVTGTDNGSGSITGTGISSGTINYTTGLVSVTFSSPPANGTAVDATYSSPAYGMALVLQNDPNGVTTSADANGIGYMTYTYNSPDNAIHNSVAILFNATSNSSSRVVGADPSMIGLYLEGGPFVNNGIYPVQDMEPQGISLFNEDVMSAHVVYDGTTLSMDLKDTTTGAVAHYAWPIDIATYVGASTAYIGFAGGTIPPGQELVNGWKWEQGAETRLTAPTFSPTPGAYASSQTVSISGPAGSTLYYTTNGKPPTTASSVYSTPLTVSANEAVQAIAVKSGSENSLPSIGNYQIQASGPTINFPSGFASANGLVQTAGMASISGSNLILSNGLQGATGSAFYVAPVSDSSFTTVFTVNFTPSVNGSHNGMTFILSNQGASQSNGVSYGLSAAPGAGATTANLASPWPGSTVSHTIEFSDGETRVVTLTSSSQSLGTFAALTNSVAASIAVIRPSNTTVDGVAYALGGGVTIGSAYGADDIGNSVALVQDEYGNTVGLSINGANPTNTSVTGLTLGLNPDQFTITYDGTTLSETVKDTVTLATFTQNWTVNIPSDVGSSTAYVGFTGAGYDSSVTQEVTAWTGF